MGYLTDFTIRIVEGEAIGNIAAVEDEIANASSYSTYVHDGEVHVEGVKWYSYEDDMRHVSAALPRLLLEVEGSGEEYPDIWAQRFRAGKAGPRVEAVISFPGLGDVE